MKGVPTPSTTNETEPVEQMLDEEEETGNLVAKALGEFAAGKLGDASGLVAAMIQQNYNDYASTTQQLMESYQHSIKRLETELAIVRWRIEELCMKPWVPNPDNILRALIVYDSDIETWKDRGHGPA